MHRSAPLNFYSAGQQKKNQSKSTCISQPVLYKSTDKTAVGKNQSWRASLYAHWFLLLLPPLISLETYLRPKSPILSLSLFWFFFPLCLICLNGQCAWRDEASQEEAANIHDIHWICNGLEGYYIPLSSCWPQLASLPWHRRDLDTSWAGRRRRTFVPTAVNFYWFAGWLNELAFVAAASMAEPSRFACSHLPFRLTDVHFSSILLNIVMRISTHTCKTYVRTYVVHFFHICPATRDCLSHLSKRPDQLMDIAMLFVCIYML